LEIAGSGKLVRDHELKVDMCRNGY